MNIAMCSLYINTKYILQRKTITLKVVNYKKQLSLLFILYMLRPVVFIPVAIMKIYGDEFFVVRIFHSKLFFLINDCLYAFIPFNFSFQKVIFGKILISAIRKKPFSLGCER